MRIKMPHIPYIVNKIILDISNSNFVELKDNIDKLNHNAKALLEADLLQEKKLDERVKELLEEQEEEMEFMQVDRKNMFWLVKKKLASEFGVILNNEDRHNNLAHLILKDFIENDFINFSVSENRVKNLIFSSIENYLKNYESIEDEISEKISHYKRKLIPGSEEYDLVFDKFYQEELKKRGML